MSKKLDNRVTLSLLLIAVFLFSLLGVNWQEGVIHGGGLTVLSQMLDGLLHPDLSPEVLRTGLNAAWQTFSYALISVSISVVAGFILGIFASGVLYDNKFVVNLFRQILGFLRAIHELVWAWLFVTAIGLNPFGAILALAIPYSGALGKVYADLLQEVPEGPLLNLKNSGANRWQLLIYGYLPFALNEMISYTLYRLECAIRSSSVLSFVGLGGLGFQIQIALADLNYSKLWVFVVFLILLVLMVDIWGNKFRENIDNASNSHTKISIGVLLLLFILAWLYIVVYDEASISDIFSQKNAAFIERFFQGLLGVNEETPAFLKGEHWRRALQLSIETIVMSIIAIGIAAIGMIILVLPSARNVKNGKLIRKKSRLNDFFFYVANLIFLVSRSLPEMMWAMIFIFIFKPGIFPGALALGVHNLGVLGKLCRDVIEEMDTAPIQNLATNGASTSQIFIYGVIPEVMSKFINYILYRWEVIIRSTVVVGFVGTGGLGVAMNLAMSFFKYSEITLYLICYVVIVNIADFLSNQAKKYIRFN